MSQLLNSQARGGLGVNIEQLNPVSFDQGIPITVSGAVAYENLGGIDHYHQGLPFTAANRIAGVLNGIVDHYGSGGAPFSVAGHLVFGAGASDHYSAGIPYTSSNQIKST